jgi:hypothetical protein
LAEEASACRQALAASRCATASGDETLRQHLLACSACRREVIARDPLWAFRLLEPASALSEELGSRHFATPGETSSERDDWDINDLRQRVHGAIRSRQMEQDRSPEPHVSGAAAAAAVFLVSCIGLVLQGSQRLPPVNAGRVEVQSHLESMPVVDAMAWDESLPAVASGASPSAESLVSRPGLEILAQMSGDEADLVWIVNESLEI